MGVREQGWHQLQTPALAAPATTAKPATCRTRGPAPVSPGAWQSQTFESAAQGASPSSGSSVHTRLGARGPPRGESPSRGAAASLPGPASSPHPCGTLPAPKEGPRRPPDAGSSEPGGSTGGESRGCEPCAPPLRTPRGPPMGGPRPGCREEVQMSARLRSRGPCSRTADDLSRLTLTSHSQAVGPAWIRLRTAKCGPRGSCRWGWAGMRWSHALRAACPQRRPPRARGWGQASSEDRPSGQPASFPLPSWPPRAPLPRDPVATGHKHGSGRQ